jgi:hypothetical protein
LLTYLYKVLLFCDAFSDEHSSTDLLRKVFKGSMEPLLRMIGSFVFYGDF